MNLLSELVKNAATEFEASVKETNKTHRFMPIQQQIMLLLQGILLKQVAANDSNCCIPYFL